MVDNMQKIKPLKLYELLRKETDDDHPTTVKAEVTFKSASTAAIFVTGGSTNGLTAWKTKEGKTIKEAIKEISG